MQNLLTFSAQSMRTLKSPSAESRTVVVTCLRPLCGTHSVVLVQTVDDVPVPVWQLSVPRTRCFKSGPETATRIRISLGDVLHRILSRVSNAGHLARWTGLPLSPAPAGCQKGVPRSASY
jgi:predicted P-loop ATPase/GTPase